MSSAAAAVFGLRHELYEDLVGGLKVEDFVGILVKGCS